MTKEQIAWSVLSLYAFVTLFLTVRGMRKTSSLKSFAVGSRDIHPAFVGLSLTAQLTSVATFVVNPGLIYAFGVSGLLGMGGAASLGIILGLIFFSNRFRAIGTRVFALSVPQWIGTRYESRGLRLFFAILSLALISFVVLIVVAIAKILAGMTGSSPQVMSVVAVVFVFGYVLVGGANTSAYTNAVQAVIMLAVAIILIASGLHLFFQEGGLLAKLATIDPNLASATNPKSLYFRNLFEVFVCNFIVGCAIVCQPHIVGKVLYLKEEKDVKIYLAVALLAGVVFMMVMFVGLYARVTLPGNLPPDSVVIHYIFKNFSMGIQMLISVGLLAAGISTLEGILLALSVIVSNDLYLASFREPAKGEAEEEARNRRALLVGRLGMIALGGVAILFSFWQIQNPTGRSVAIFGQYGVYLLFTVSFLPLACGMFLPQISRRAIAMSAVAATLTYFATAYFQITFMHNNPAFLATMAAFAGWLVIALMWLGGDRAKGGGF
jgi:SSS family solute:Na+ symporter/sodium/pantothenate symporter